jgi:hypothetical protein
MVKLRTVCRRIDRAVEDVYPVRLAVHAIIIFPIVLWQQFNMLCELGIAGGVFVIVTISLVASLFLTVSWDVFVPKSNNRPDHPDEDKRPSIW